VTGRLWDGQGCPGNFICGMAGAVRATLFVGWPQLWDGQGCPGNFICGMAAVVGWPGLSGQLYLWDGRGCGMAGLIGCPRSGPFGPYEVGKRE